MSGRRFALLYVAPILLLLAVTIWPLASGAKTLYLRDLLNTHLEMKHAQAEAMRAGYLPLLDPYRAGGQPLLGNPNAVPLHPDNLLYLLAPTLWALNAHLWLHWLLAPFAMYWLGRSWGLERPAAWAAGVVYAFSGYFVSHLIFYNLIAGAALAPAFAAAALDLNAGRRRLAAVWLALLWALLVVAGEPLVAAMALVLAATAMLAQGVQWRPTAVATTALAAGTLLAAPQLVELWRILPLSFRGYYGYAPGSLTVQSFDPRQAIEWLLPFFFGRPDLIRFGTFWGGEYYTDSPPYFVSLYPGLLALALVAAAGRPRDRRAWWAVGVAALGFFFALGRFNPVARAVLAWPALRVVRYPVKLWLLVAVGLALLAGLAFARLLDGDPAARRRLRWGLGAAAAVLGFGWIVLTFVPGGAAPLLDMISESYSAAFRDNERQRWAGLALLSLLTLGGLVLALLVLRRRPALGGAMLLAVHAATQLFFLRPALATDEVEHYVKPSPLLAAIPRDALSAHGPFLGLFGHSTLSRGIYPDGRMLWYERRAFFELYPFAGALHGRRFELNVSPEGLDSFLTRIARAEVERAADDRKRLRLLRAWGVSRVLLNREVEPAAAQLARLLSRAEFVGQEILLYEVLDPAPEVGFLGEVHRAPSLGQALVLLSAGGFDPQRAVVVPGPESSTPGAGGTARAVSASPESVTVQVEAASPGVLVWQRAYLPLYRATIDGRAAPVVVANAHRIGIEVPPGSHQVRIWADRGPTRRSLWLVALGALGLPGLVWLSGRKRP